MIQWVNQSERGSIGYFVSIFAACSCYWVQIIGVFGHFLAANCQIGAGVEYIQYLYQRGKLQTTGLVVPW